MTRFIHSASTLETVDIYADELLTSLYVDDLQFQVATPDIETTRDARTYYFTPADSVATVLFELEVGAQTAGTFTDIHLIGDTDDWTGIGLVPRRASSAISVRLNVFHASLNYPLIDIYLKNRGDPLTEDDVRTLSSSYPIRSPVVEIDAGSYDIRLTDQGTLTEITAPYPIDVSVGDIVDLAIVDTVDPAVVEIMDVPVP